MKYRVIRSWPGVRNGQEIALSDRRAWPLLRMHMVEIAEDDFVDAPVEIVPVEQKKKRRGRPPKVPVDD